jgi:SAM-dependent methyltransferase
LVSDAPALDRAREAAHSAGDYVGQESFMRRGEIHALAESAGIAAGTSVLDLCCGIAGPGRYIARTFGCRYVGVDRDAGAIRIARVAARGLPCEFLVQAVPPLPAGRFDVVLLLETLLAFRDKKPLLGSVAGALDPGGRFGFTLEAGRPLTDAERARMPAADTVWLTPLEDVREMLRQAGMTVRREDDVTIAHRDTAAALLRAYTTHAAAIEAETGPGAVDDLLASHRMWVEWLSSGRVRKIAVVAERIA